MRTTLRIAVASLAALVAVHSVGADDQKGARAVIDKAIKAQGGADKLAKYKGSTWSEKGTYYGMGDGLPYTGTYAVLWPDKMRMDIENAFVMVLNGDKGWVQMNGETKEMTKEQLAAEKEERYAGWVTTLVPLKDKGFTLTPVGDAKVEGDAATGVKVSHKGHGDVTLFFSKKSGLLVKSEHRAKDMQNGGKEVNQEAFYSDYKNVSGVQVPMKVVLKRDGKPFVDEESSDVKLATALDDKLFGKP